MNLNSFTYRRDDWEFTILPNGFSFLPNEKSIALSVTGASGVEVVSNNTVATPLSYSESTILNSLRLRENSEYDFMITMPLTKTEFLKKKNENKIFPFKNLKLQSIVTFNPPDAYFVQEGPPFRISGRMRFSNFAGSVYFEFQDCPSLSFSAEVVTAKLDYEEEFSTLLSDLSQIHSELILRLDSPVEVMLGTNHDVRASFQIQMLHLRHLFRVDILPTAMATILQQPAFRCRSLLKREPSALATHIDLVELQTMYSQLDWIAEGPLRKTFNGYTPLSLPTRQIEYCFDIVENQFVKFVLESLLHRIQQIEEQIPSEYEPSRKSLELWSEEIRLWLSHPFWRNVGNCNVYPNSMILMRRRGYRELLQSIISLDIGMSLSESIGQIDYETGDLKPVYDLYEVWCYFQLHQVLSQLCLDTGLPRLENILIEKKFRVDLKRGFRYPISFEYEKEGTVVNLKLFYNRTFEKVSDDKIDWQESYSAAFHPDFSISIEVKDQVHWIHFDAKYKLDIKELQEQFENVNAPKDAIGKQIQTFKRIDLHTMHSYRDALLGTRACYILYPNSNASCVRFIRHADVAYRSMHPSPSVGAIGLRPLNNETKREQLGKLYEEIERIINVIVESSGYREEEGFFK